MIVKVNASFLDEKYLTLCPNIAIPISADLSRLVVNKPWGREHLAFHSSLIEIWHLAIECTKATSMHCHPRKKTALVVLEGRALFSTLNKSFELKPRDAAIIDCGVFHSTQALNPEGIKVLEFETPPMKYDLVRLEDKYGRANMGYEGPEKMIVANRSCLQIADRGNGKKKRVYNNQLGVYSLKNSADLEKIPQVRSALLVILDGSVIDRRGRKLCSIADAVTFKDLTATGNIFNHVSVLSISPTTG